MYRTGIWGDQAKLRSKKRAEYFRERWRRLHKGGKDIFPKFYRLGELEALKILKNSIDRNKETNADFDILWEGKKIDVKTAHFKFFKNRIGKNGKVIGSSKWKFKLTQRGIVDYFLFVCFENDKISYVFLIPDKEFGDNKYFSLPKSKIEKYSKYLIK